MDSWMEGNVHEPIFVDAFQDKYGTDEGLWMRRTKAALGHEGDNITVFRNLESDGNLAECLGEYYDTGSVTRGSLLTFTSSINWASNPTEYNAIRRSVAPF